MTRRRFLLDLTAASAGLAAAALWASRREPKEPCPIPPPRPAVKGDVAVPPADPPPMAAGEMVAPPAPSPSPSPSTQAVLGRVAH